MAALTDVARLMFGVLAGASLGFGAARVCDVLPRRAGVAPVAPLPHRSRRNVAVMGMGAALGGGIVRASASAPWLVAIDLTVALMLLAAAVIDFEHMILPNELTFGAGLLALVSAPWRPLGAAGSLAGVGVSFALTMLPFVLYKFLRGRSGMGLGDAKLAMAAGAWLGPVGALFVILGASVQSALAALVLRRARIKLRVPPSVEAELARLREQAAAGDEEAAALLADDPMAEESASDAALAMRMPWGPFLVLASYEFLLAGSVLRRVLDVD